MRPTARADELREPLRQALEALERAVSPASPFNPAEARQTWNVMASDYGETTIVLPALAGLRSSAPDTRLAVFDLVPSQIARQAEQGAIDLAFHTSEDAPLGLRRRALFTEQYVFGGSCRPSAVEKKATDT